MADPDAESATRPSFYVRWLSPGGYLGLHLVVGFVLALAAGLAFKSIADRVFGAPTTLAADAWAQEVVSSIRTPALTVIMSWASDVGSRWPLTVLSVAVGLTLMKVGAKRRLYAFAATMIGGPLLNLLLKEYFQRPRPSEIEPLVVAHGYSFPSGHSMGSMLFFGSLAYVVYVTMEGSRAARAAAVALCVLTVLVIGGSRIYLHVHYLSDVVAGFAAGLCWLAVCISGAVAWARWRNWRRARRAGRAA
jgi:undecaprenyl-diphosphatase